MHTKPLLAAAMLSPCAVASAQIVINEPGFAVDTLVVGQLDQTTPRIEAIRNPAFGSGVGTGCTVGQTATPHAALCASISDATAQTFDA